MPWPPACCTRSAVSSIVLGRLSSERCVRVVRPVQYTVAPAAPSSIAMPRPAPRVAPATSATLPLSTWLIIQLSLSRCRRELRPNESVFALKPGLGFMARGSMLLPSGSNCDHPTDAEAVGEHAEARRPKGLRERHPHLTAIREGGKRALGFGLVGHR